MAAMEDSQFNIERATNGFVMALYVAAAIFLGLMLYFVWQDMNERAAEAAAAESATGAVRVDEPPSGAETQLAPVYPIT